jgi:hypothetical protein
MTGTPRDPRGPVQTDRDTMTKTTFDQAQRHAPRPAPATPAPQPGTPQPSGLSAAEIRRIVLDILG